MTHGGWPLRTRLVVIATSLIALGLLLAGVTSTVVLHTFLAAQVDQKLRSEGALAAHETYEYTRDGDHAVPSDYYIEVQVGTDRYTWLSERVGAEYGKPSVPLLDAAAVTELAGQPFTVLSSTGERWRAVAYQISSPDGVVVVALPLGDIDDTIGRMTMALLVAGLAIVLMGGAAAGWAVDRSLRPLREMEDTAQAIAAGDLSRRVPAAPTGTEVGRLGAALNGMLSQIEQAFAARTASEARMRRFVSDASHELRTPLAAVRGYAELYRMGALTSRGEIDDTMSRIEGSATRMGGLVEDLLALARLDEGRALEQHDVDLVVLAADAAADLMAIDPTRTVTVVGIDGGPPGPCHLQADETRLRQVLSNLVGNVSRHTPSGSPAQVAVGTSEVDGTDAAVLEVRDHGPGIPAEHAGRIFERFYRVDSSRTRDSGGAGLGMAIVASIVSAHHGQVEVHDTPGGGATVRVSIPMGRPNVTDTSGPGIP